MGLYSTLSTLAMATLGIISYVCLMIAEAKKPKQSSIPVTTEDGFYVCEYPSDPSVALSAIAVTTMFLTALIAHVYASVPFVFKTFNVFAKHHRLGVYVWYFLACAGTVTTIVVTSYAAWQQKTHHRNASQQINGPDGALADPATDYHASYYEYAWNPAGILCPTVKTGIFGGMGMIMMGTTLLWLAFAAMADTARELETGEYYQDYMEGASVSAKPLVLPGDGKDDMDPTDLALGKGVYATALK